MSRADAGKPPAAGSFWRRTMTHSEDGTRITGHGSEWKDSNLSPEEARTATAWAAAASSR